MRWLLIVLVLVLGNACKGSDAPPLAPSLPIVVSVPASITLDVSPATANSESLITLYVRDSAGSGVSGATVSLSTTAGSLTPSTVTSGPSGQAQSRLKTTQNATVTARIGDVVTIAHASAYQAPPVFVPPPFVKPTPPPVPPPVVTPPPPTPAPTLAVTVTCVAATHGLPTPCNITASYGGSLLLGTAITDVDWDWGDGTQDLDDPDPLATHSYVQAGSYTTTAVVTATTVDGAKTATATKALTIP